MRQAIQAVIQIGAVVIVVAIWVTVSGISVADDGTGWRLAVLILNSAITSMVFGGLTFMFFEWLFADKDSEEAA